MLSPYKIRWQDKISLSIPISTSIDLNLWVELAFDSDNGESETYLNRAAVASESYNGALKRVHGYKWEQSFTPKFTFIKQNYEEFTADENRTMLTWLTSAPNAAFLDVYKDRDKPEDVTFSILGNFITVKQYKLGNGRIVGYVAEFESVTPWALSPLRTRTKDVSHPADPKDATIEITLTTDEPQSAVYPRITIEQLGTVIAVDHEMSDTDENWVKGSVFTYNGTYYWIDSSDDTKQQGTENPGLDTTSVAIKNIYTDDQGVIHTFRSLVKNNLAGETVVIDGANRVISSSLNEYHRVFGDDFTWQWIPLYQGKNILSFVGNCNVTIEYREPIKCGEF